MNIFNRMHRRGNLIIGHCYADADRVDASGYLLGAAYVVVNVNSAPSQSTVTKVTPYRGRKCDTTS